ncbi:MAG: IS630 family transposase [Marinobacterium sp.]|nr:IS630 family transposase [Marinobacterium sp.]
MKKEDARKLKPSEQELLRRKAVRLREKELTFKKIGELLDVHPDTVGRWCRAYEAEGQTAIKARKRGRRIGEWRQLSGAQEQRVIQEISDKMPDQHKLNFALWTRRAVQQLIKQLWGIQMPIRTVGEYLKRWGFTPQKPLKRAYEQSPTRVKHWLEEEYPAIKARAKTEGAEICWGDETGLRSDTQHGRSYAPRGKTPVQVMAARRCSVNMISAISNQGMVRFMVYEGSMNAKVLIRFMKRLIKTATRKVFLILDNLRVHHAKLVRAWLNKESIRTAIEVFYLPPYSPELNPDEYLNCDLKANVHTGASPRSQDILKSRVVSHMRRLQQLPDRVKKYFSHPAIAYAV